MGAFDVTGLGNRYAPQSLKLIATAIRAFLGFAWMSGWTRCDLTAAVGPVVTHRFGRLPKALSAEDLQRLLAVPDRRTTMGLRDYALLMVMSRLGLRAVVARYAARVGLGTVRAHRLRHSAALAVLSAGGSLTGGWGTARSLQ